MSKFKLKELCKPNQIGKYGIPAAAEDYDAGKVRYLRISDIDDYGNLLDNDKKSVSSDDINKYLLEEGDLVVARTGNSTGRTYYHENKNGVLAFAGFLIKYGLDKSKVNPKYIKYYTISKEYKEWVKNLSVGSTRGNINAQTFAECPVSIPNRKQQNLLVDILSALDDKIELNNKINTELEAMAKTLYDYWFVQFDFPDANGKPYKSSGGKMVWNETLKREIPEGWEVKKLSSLVEVKDGTHDSPKYILGEGYPLITSKNLKKTGIDFTETNRISKFDFDLINQRSKVDTGDILFSMIGNIGTIYKIEEEIINFAIKNVALFKTSSNPLIKNYLFQYLHGYDMQRYVPNVISGSIQKFIALGSLRNTPILFKKAIIEEFNNISFSIYNKLKNNLRQNQELAQLRDWLLPMLMNGQVTVGEAEEKMGMVAEGAVDYKKY